MESEEYIVKPSDLGCAVTIIMLLLIGFIFLVGWKFSVIETRLESIEQRSHEPLPLESADVD
jgi:uncharacterized membrane protein YjgN (DUF898 family)